jgi:TM2 domain-containing membrane protein YozV
MHYQEQIRYMEDICGDHCFRHDDRSPVGYCAFCGRPVCDECHKGAYCTLCVEKQPKKKSTVLLLAVFLGWLGAHRFYMRFWFTGVIYLCTFGLLGIGWILDVIRILFCSTVKAEPTHSLGEDFAGALGDAIMSTSDTTRWFFNHRFWRDEYFRPLLPIAQKSLE